MHPCLGTMPLHVTCSCLGHRSWIMQHDAYRHADAPSCCALLLLRSVIFYHNDAQKEAAEKVGAAAVVWCVGRLLLLSNQGSSCSALLCIGNAACHVPHCSALLHRKLLAYLSNRPVAHPPCLAQAVAAVNEQLAAGTFRLSGKKKVATTIEPACDYYIAEASQPQRALFLFPQSCLWQHVNEPSRVMFCATCAAAAPGACDRHPHALQISLPSFCPTLTTAPLFIVYFFAAALPSAIFG